MRYIVRDERRFDFRGNEFSRVSGKFRCKTYPDNGAAQAALAMLQHRDHLKTMLAGLGGWKA